MGTTIEDIREYLVRDSTYAPLSRYLNGFRGSDVVDDMGDFWMNTGYRTRFEGPQEYRMGAMVWSPVFPYG